MNARPIAIIRPNVIQINLADLEIKRWGVRLPAAFLRSVHAVIDAPLLHRVLRCLPSKYFGFNCSNIRDRYLTDLVSVLVHDDDEPTGPVPARHCRALLEIAGERYRVGASGGIARQVNAFVDYRELVCRR